MSLKRDSPPHDFASSGEGGGGDGSASPTKKGKLVGNDAYAYAAANYCQNFLEAILADDNFHSQDRDGIHAVMKNIFNPYSPHKSDVVIRDDDHQFWEACIGELEDPKKRNRVAVVGTPGIGKTTTSYFAMRMLLKMRKKVVYLYRTEDKSNPYIVFTPSESDSGTISIELFPESTPATTITALQDKDTYYIVDPGQTKTNCTPEGAVMAKVIIVASPDKRHWGGSAFEKKEPGRDPGMFRYFPPWSLNQLKAGASRIDSMSNLPAREIEKLFSLFGGIPRLVYDPEAKDNNLQSLERKVNELELSEMKKLLAGRGSLHAGFGQDQPKGGIMLFQPKSNFSQVDVEAASDKVVESIRGAFMDAVWDDLATYGSPIAWQLLESFISEALHGTKDYVTRPCVGKSDLIYSNEGTTTIGGVKFKCQTSDCTTAVRYCDDMVLYYSSNRFHPLYDMIFKCNNIYFAFQVTTGKKHKATKADIAKVVGALGIRSGGPELRLYYAVHEAVFDEFVTEPTSPFCPPCMSVHHMKISRRAS